LLGGKNEVVTTQYDSIISEASKKYGVDEKLIKAVIQQESGFQNFAGSPVGAQGLMQLMPATARSLGVTNSFSPNQNIMAGTNYLSQQIKRFGSVELGLAAYNAGPGNVGKYGGIPPFAETQNYVKKIMSTYKGDGLTEGGGVTHETENLTTTSTILYGVLRTVFLLMLFIVGLIFFMRAFPATDNLMKTGKKLAKVAVTKKVV
jgi:hypothetical protein